MNRKVGVGVLWNLASLFVARGATTVFTIFLARLLAPEEFGLLAMVTFVFEVAGAFVSCGLGQALIRSKLVSSVDLNTVFFANIFMGCVVYALLFVGAPLISGFYSHSELTSLIQVMGMVVFADAAVVVQVAVFSRNMDFKSQMKANALGVMVSGGLALTAAWSGWGVWSLVVQVLTSRLCTTLLLWVKSDWRPVLQFSFESFRRLFGFGKNILMEEFLQVAFQNSYILAIGRIFSVEVTGLYFFARKISDLISQQLTGAVQQATFPALAVLQDDNSVLREKYQKIMRFMMFAIAPVMALLAGLAYPIFAVLFDERWHSAVPYLQILCAAGAIYPLHALNVNLLNVKGRSDLVLKIGVIKKGVNLFLLFLSIPYGVLGVVVGQVLGSVLALIPNTHFSGKLIGYGFKAQLFDVINPIMAALAGGLAAYWFSSLSVGSSLLSIVYGAGGGLVVWFFLSLALQVEAAKLLAGKFVRFL